MKTKTKESSGHVREWNASVGILIYEALLFAVGILTGLLVGLNIGSLR